MEEEAGSQQPRHAALDDPEFAKYWRGPASGEGAGLALLTVSVALPQDTDMHCAGCLEWAFVGRARLAQQGERLSVPALAAPPLAAAAAAAASAEKPSGSMYRHQWFQSPDRVEVRAVCVCICCLPSACLLPAICCTHPFQSAAAVHSCQHDASPVLFSPQPPRPHPLPSSHSLPPAAVLQVDVLAKGLKKEQVAVTIGQQRLRVVTTDAEGAWHGWARIQGRGAEDLQLTACRLMQTDA